MAIGVRTHYRRGNLIAHLPHILTAEALLRPGSPYQSRRLEETLQIEGIIVALRLPGRSSYLLPQRPEFLQESSQGLKPLFLKGDYLIDAGITLQQRTSHRLHHPYQPGIRIGFLDGIGHRKGMDNIADSAELHHQNRQRLIHDKSPAADCPAEARAIIPEVDRPGTRSMNATSPP